MSVVVELAQPRTIIERVDGADVWVFVDHPYVYVRRDDVERAAGIPPWSTGEQLFHVDEPTVEFKGAVYWPIEYAIARANDESLTPDRAARFLSWLDDAVQRILEPAVLENAHRTVGFAAAHPVATAASILSEELGIRLGRDGLFAHLDDLGWTERNPDQDMRVITKLPWDRDWLVHRSVTIGAGKSARRYLQIHVTTAGMTELRKTLADRLPAAACTATAIPLPLFD